MTPTDTTPECPRPECVQGRETAVILARLSSPAELRQHLGEMTAQELRTAQAAVRYTLAATEAIRAQAAPSEDLGLLSLIFRIREAAGDKAGKLMQDELVERIAGMTAMIERKPKQ